MMSSDKYITVPAKQKYLNNDRSFHFLAVTGSQKYPTIDADLVILVDGTNDLGREAEKCFQLLENMTSSVQSDNTVDANSETAYSILVTFGFKKQFDGSKFVMESCANWKNRMERSEVFAKANLSSILSGGDRMELEKTAKLAEYLPSFHICDISRASGVQDVKIEKLGSTVATNEYYDKSYSMSGQTHSALHKIVYAIGSAIYTALYINKSNEICKYLEYLVNIANEDQGILSHNSYIGSSNPRSVDTPIPGIYEPHHSVHYFPSILQKHAGQAGGGKNELKAAYDYFSRQGQIGGGLGMNHHKFITWVEGSPKELLDAFLKENGAVGETFIRDATSNSGPLRRAPASSATRYADTIEEKLTQDIKYVEHILEKKNSSLSTTGKERFKTLIEKARSAAKALAEVRNEYVALVRSEKATREFPGYDTYKWSVGDINRATKNEKKEQVGVAYYQLDNLIKEISKVFEQITLDLMQK